jgi:hypothetical protein
MNELMTDTLVAEYETIIADLGAQATDEQIMHTLVGQADWTERGAVAIVTLAREYGSAVLRNALALADAMGIDDGEAGL